MAMNWSSELDLPGFRFHPTEEELLDFYLKGAVRGNKLHPEIIRTLNIYRHHPMELPGMARGMGEREWYFFVPRDRRSHSGGRPSRTTEKGFWKATGSDRTIRSAADPDGRRIIGMKKTLVFYEGRAPRGARTDWVMNEYRLPEAGRASPTPKEDIVLCKIYRKATSMKELEQRAAMDKDATAPKNIGSAGHINIGTSTAADNASGYSFSTSSCSDHKTTTASPHMSPTTTLPLVMTTDVPTSASREMESAAETEAEVTSLAAAAPLTRPVVLPELDMLQVPPRQGFDWAHVDPFMAPLRSPWLDIWSPLYANILNF